MSIVNQSFKKKHYSNESATEIDNIYSRLYLWFSQLTKLLIRGPIVQFVVTPTLRGKNENMQYETFVLSWPSVL